VRDETPAIGVDSAELERANSCRDLELFIQLALKEYYNSLEHIRRLREIASIVVSADMIVLSILGSYLVSYLSKSRLGSSIIYIIILSATVLILASIYFSLRIVWPHLRADVDPELLIKAYENKQWDSRKVAVELLSAASFNANIRVMYEDYVKTSIIALYLGLLFIAIGEVVALIL
jgi:flagellar biosynthesis regulator FlbT